MMKVAQLDKDIDNLNLDKSVIERLKKNQIYTIKDIWVLTRKDLKKMGFNDHDLYQIIVNLQLMGVDLNKKIY